MPKDKRSSRRKTRPPRPTVHTTTPAYAVHDDTDQAFDAEIAKLERETARMPQVIMAVFAAVAVISLSVAAITSGNAVRRLAREVRVPGYVVEMTARRDAQGQELYYPVVTFDLPDGTRKTVQLSDGSWPAAYEPDDQVMVAYDPEQPLRARIASDGSGWLPWIGPLITGALGLVFLGAVFFVRAFFKPEPPPMERGQAQGTRLE